MKQQSEIDPVYICDKASQGIKKRCPDTAQHPKP